MVMDIKYIQRNFCFVYLVAGYRRTGNFYSKYASQSDKDSTGIYKKTDGSKSGWGNSDCPSDFQSENRSFRLSSGVVIGIPLGIVMPGMKKRI